jgi:Domain of unknown function (DUF4173)
MAGPVVVERDNRSDNRRDNRSDNRSDEARLPVRSILIAALVLGVAGDVLLRDGMFRLGLTLWTTLLAGSAVILGDRANPERLWLLFGTAAATLGFVWRDAEFIRMIDLLSALCMGALLLWRGRGVSMAHLTVLETMRAAMLAVVQTIGGAPRLAQQGLANRDGSPTRARRLKAIAAGTVLAIPPVFIVAGLLAESDAVFEGVLDTIGRLLAIDGAGHLLLIVVLTWITTGWLRAALGSVIRTPFAEIGSPGLPFLSVGIGLYGLVSLLALFLGTQARVLFGGEAFLMATEGLTLATYARSGFFQLVVAAGVVLATLVAAEWTLATDDVAGRRRFRVAGMLLIVEVAALLVSAAVRFSLYLREFGVSVDRLVACAGIVWVGATLLTFAFTTLRGRTARFAPVTLLVTIGWVALLNGVNLEAVVARVNIERGARGLLFDAEYHASLSADALPALVDGAARLPAPYCRALDAAMRAAWVTDFAPQAPAGDWRAWSLPQARAAAWVAAGAVTCPASVANAAEPEAAP